VKSIYIFARLNTALATGLLLGLVSHVALGAGLDSNSFLGPAPDGDVYVVLSTHDFTKESNAIHRVNTQGSVVWKRTIHRAGSARIEAVSWLPDGPQLFGTRSDDSMAVFGPLWFTTFTPDGHQGNAVDFLPVKSSASAVAAASREFIYVAHALDKTAVSKESDPLEVYGNDLQLLLVRVPDSVQWDRVIDVQGDAALAGGCLMESGSFVVLTNAGSYSKFGCGDSSIFLVRYGKDGTELARAAFPDRQAISSIISDGESAYFAFSNGTTPPCMEENPDLPPNTIQFEADSVLTKVDGTLTTLWEKNLPPCVIGGYPKLTVTDTKGCVVASASFEALTVHHFDAAGAEVWRTTIPVDENPLSEVQGVDDVLVSGEQVFILCAQWLLEDDAVESPRFAIATLSASDGKIEAFRAIESVEEPDANQGS
jgi:hypothetical protein